MPYATAYKIISEQSQTGHTWNVYIEDRELDSDDITELKAGGVMVDIRYQPVGFYSSTPHWNLATSTCTVEFIDDETGVLSDIIGADDERYRIRVEGNSDDEWLGYVLPDSYSYTLYGKNIGRISATDRLTDLQAIPYSQGGGVLYSGRVSLLKALTQCLDSTGLSLGLSTHCNWYPYLSSNALDTDDDILERLRVDQDNFTDADGNPYSKFTVLDQLLRRFQLQLFQSEKRWFIQHRRREVSGSNYRVFQYDDDATPDSGDATFNHTARVEVAVDGDSNQQIVGRGTVSGTIPYGSVASTYYHGNPFDGLFFNLSFEEGLQDTVGGTPLLSAAVIVGQDFINFDGVTASVNIPSGRRFQLAGDDTEYKFTAAAEVNGSGQATNVPIEPKIAIAAADNTAITFHADHGGWERISDTFATTQNEGQNLTDNDVKALELPVEFDPTPLTYDGWVRQESVGVVAGSSGLRLKTGWAIKVPGISDVTTELYFAFKMYITGTSETWYFKWSDTTWTNTDTTNEIPLASFGWADDVYQRFEIFTDELNDGVDDIAGPLTIEFLEGKEVDSGGSQNVTKIHIDNVSEPVIILSDGSVSNEATRTLITYTGNVNRSSPNVPTAIIGDGPTVGHISRLTVLDSTDAEVSTTDDWAWLPPSFVSGVSLDQFWANEMLKEFRQSNKKIRATFFTKEGSSPPKPHQYFVLANPNNTVEQDYTWQDLTYRPVNHEQILSGTFIEYQRGADGDQICVVDIKPNTALLAGIDVDQGLVCDSTDPFTPPNVPDTVYVLLANKQIRKAVIDRGATGWNTTLIRTDGATTVYDLKVAQSKGVMFTVVSNFGDDNRYIQKSDLVGGVPFTIATISPVNPSFAPDCRIDISVAAERIFAVGTNYTSDDYIKVYDFDGTVLKSGTPFSDRTVIGAVAAAPDGSYCQYVSFASGNYYLEHYDYATNATTEVGAISGAAVSGTMDAGFIDTVEDKLFFKDGADNDVIWFDPGSGGSANVNTVVTGITEGGIAGDRVYKQFYVGDANQDIVRYEYDGTGSTVVSDLSSIGSTIRHLHLGV